MLGKGVSDGIGVGCVKIIDKLQTGYNIVHKGTPTEEINRLSKSIENLYSRIKNGNLDLNKEQKEILLSHLVFLKDPAVIHKLNENIYNGLCAEEAVEKVFSFFSEMFSGFEDNTMAQKSVDMTDISARLICELQNKKYYDLSHLPENTILVVKEITPSMLISLGNKRIEGIIVESCGEFSHSVIIARAVGIPMVINVKDFDFLEDGKRIIVNGSSGEIIQNPPEEELNKYWLIKRQIYLDDCELKSYISKKVTYKGKEVRFMANVSSQVDIKNGEILNINGIGICRTECLFMGYDHVPTEEEQYNVYCQMASSVNESGISIRVFDIGGDKEIDWLDSEYILPNERGIRYCLSHSEIFYTQLRAILRASGVYNNIRILLPFVSSIDEIYETKRIIKSITDELQKENIPIGKDLKLGAMIETPGAVFIMDLLAKEVDFFSVGTNDLIHSLLVSDRFSENRNTDFSPLHPAIMRCIYYIIKQAHKEKKPVALCGEIASNPYFIPIWLAFGFTIFSVSPSLVLKVKRAVCNTIENNKAMDIHKLFNCTTTDEVENLIKKYT